jgi:hypothetical protein
MTEEEHMANPRVADDFRAIRARMEELRRERERVDGSETDVRPVRLSLFRANGDPIIISVRR